MIMRRPDVAGGVAFVAILRMFPLRWQRFTLVPTFIPTRIGGISNGSVPYVFGRFAPD